GAPIFLKSTDPAELAREHKRLGYGAAYCPAVKLEEKERIRAIESAFQAEGVVISEVGRWVNLMDADPAKRAANLKTVTDGLALADEVGARCCVDIAGSMHEKVWYGPHAKNFSKEFFDAAVENARKIIDAVKPKRAKFCYEMMGWAIPDTADNYLKLIKAVARPGFAVHLDLCNAVNSVDKFYNNAALSRECISKLGKWIVSSYAKDLAFIPEMNVHFVEVVPGRGEIDYKAFLTALRSLPAPAPLMIEHLKGAEEYAEAAKYIRSVDAAL
ncbi:MAG: sugar phosphate isomerase/epimerase, partial [Bryobacteraceae bacterium]|nr:sugar phosphate isomerase/epimerase [Bryobacteraceae bacterium]